MTSPALSERDMVVLRHYAAKGNRELYWNYLAQLPGNDGYGRLALGVVRNDNMPGATANLYAQNYAWRHHRIALSEREWDRFGVDLMQRDLVLRQIHLAKQEPALALNLPAANVRDAHKAAFQNIKVDADAWTPNKLLTAARRAGEAEAARQIAAHRERGEPVPDEAAYTARIVDQRMEKVWSSMLDNDALGLYRGADTLASLAAAQDMPVVDRLVYARDMAEAYAGAMHDRPHLDPHLIGKGDRHYTRDEDGRWLEQRVPPPLALDFIDRVHAVEDGPLRRELEDTHRLRHEREAARDAMHPDDPGKHIASPHPLADARPLLTLPQAGDDPIYAAIRLQMPIEVTDDKVAEAALAARQAGIHRESDLPPVDLNTRDMIVFGSTLWRPGFAVDATTPAPPREASLAQAATLDEQAVEREQERQMELAMTARQAPSHRMRGPVLDF